MKNTFPLSILHPDIANGLLDIEPNLNNLYRIELSDFYGNKTVVSIPIEYSPDEPTVEDDTVKTSYFVKANIDSNFEKDNCSVFFLLEPFMMIFI